jgi:hypothetical protein
MNTLRMRRSMPMLHYNCWHLWHRTLREQILSAGFQGITCSPGIGGLVLLEPDLALRSIDRTAVVARLTIV